MRNMDIFVLGLHDNLFNLKIEFEKVDFGTKGGGNPSEHETLAVQNGNGIRFTSSKTGKAKIVLIISEMKLHRFFGQVAFFSSLHHLLCVQSKCNPIGALLSGKQTTEIIIYA